MPLLAVEIAPVAGAWPVRHAQVRTAADGSFAYVLGSGPSRRIILSYRAFAEDAVPSARATANVLVTPAISLRITPTHTVNGHTITFTGRVSGGDEPRGGLPLDLEYREGSRWMIYDMVRARAGRRAVNLPLHVQAHHAVDHLHLPRRHAAGGVSGYPVSAEREPGSVGARGSLRGARAASRQLRACSGHRGAAGTARVSRGGAGAAGRSAKTLSRLPTSTRRRGVDA